MCIRDRATIWQYLYETGAANNATGSGSVANIENIKTAVSLSWDDEMCIRDRVIPCFFVKNSYNNF